MQKLLPIGQYSSLANKSVFFQYKFFVCTTG